MEGGLELETLSAAELELEEEDVRFAVAEANQLKVLFEKRNLEWMRALQDQATISQRLCDALASHDTLKALRLHSDMAQAQRDVDSKSAAAEAALNLKRAATDVALKLLSAWEAQGEVQRSRLLANEARRVHTIRYKILGRMTSSPHVQSSMAELSALLSVRPENDPETVRWLAFEKEAKTLLIASLGELRRAKDEYGLVGDLPESIDASLSEDCDRRVRQRTA